MLQARSLSADYGMPGMYGAGYDTQLEMGGLGRSSFEGLNPRDLLFPEAYAPANFQDMSAAAFMGVRHPSHNPLLQMYSCAPTLASSSHCMLIVL